MRIDKRIDLVNSGMAEYTTKPTVKPDKKELIDNILKLAQEERKKGNNSITEEKLNNLSNYVRNYQLKPKDTASTKSYEKYKKDYPVPKVKPSYSPLFDKFSVKAQNPPVPKAKLNRDLPFQYTFKNIERVVIEVLENLANILDNLHLFSKFPMFPSKLVDLLKQTNKLWVLILVFLIRKTISQLLNVIRKERKVNVELSILRLNKNSKLLTNKDDNNDEKSIFRRYEKVLKDLKFDKMMLVLELIGNFLDMGFNLIELYGIPVPDWFMSVLNVASMGMTIYRMNKDDEYIDDDITEDLI